MTGLPTSPCSSCGAPMIWTVTAANGRRMPVDADPVTDPAVAGPLFWLGGRNPIRSHALVGLQIEAHRASGDARALYRSHFATCPDADRHRRAS